MSEKIKNEPDEKKKWAMYLQYINEKKFAAPIPRQNKNVPHILKK